MRLRKKATLSGFAGAAAIIMVGSAAFACVTFAGNLTLTTPRTNGSTVTGDDAGGSMVYCSGGEPTTAATANKGDSITYTVATASICASSTNKLNAGTNNIYVNNSTTAYSYNGTQWVFNTNGTQGCFLSSPPAGNKLQGTMTVSSTGSGSASIALTLPASPTVNGTTNASVACVGVSGGPGIFAPLRVLTTI